MLQDLTQHFLSHLCNVEEVSFGTYLASCSAHDDDHPSLLITEADDKLLLHCRAGCRPDDVLAAVGLDYSDLFLDTCKFKGTLRPTTPRRPPKYYWKWQKTCAELERAIQFEREHHEAVLAATQGIDINILSNSEFDEAMGYVCLAYSWLGRCDRLDSTLFYLQQTLRGEEQYNKRLRKNRMKA